MRFEFSLAFKYLVPKKKHLSVSLISLMSVGVISLVVWLLLVFLSITDGIERNWLKKLTDLHAPIKVTPTPAYFSSYYYKIDSLSHRSHFSLKTLGEKLQAESIDPYDPQEDPEIPPYFEKPTLNSQGELIDPVRGLVSVLQSLPQKGVSFQDYEMSSATLKLQMLRSHAANRESLHFLTQVSYLSTIPQHLPLSTAPTLEDVKHLFFLAGYRMDQVASQDAPIVEKSREEFRQRIAYLLDSIQVEKMRTFPQFTLPLSVLPSHKKFLAYASLVHGTPQKILLASDSRIPPLASLATGYLEGGFFLYEGNKYPLPKHFPLMFSSPIVFSSHIDKNRAKEAGSLEEITITLKGKIQGHALAFPSLWKDLEIEAFSLQAPLKIDHFFSPSQGIGILLPKSFKDSGVFLGDRGFLSYSASTFSSLQEQRTPIFVAGFYDPGVISIGNKCLLVPKEITRTINGANSSITFDKISLNGFQVWCKDPKEAFKIKQEVQQRLEKKQLDMYWNVTSFQEYDFAKELLEQFQSDRTLFSIIGIIILCVACCNILSSLILLVNDKKREIAILQAMGASKKSIAGIFGLLGIIIGLLGSIIGTGAAMVTLANMDTVAKILTHIQGHNAFHEMFYGSSLPNSLSSQAFLFIVIATPVLSLLAGLIPALRACRLHPCTILRSES